MTISNKIISLLKKIPIDLGQESVSEITKGKQIALSYVKEGKKKTALDVGCRKGIQTRLLRKKGYKVTSIDIEKNFKDCIIMDVNKKLPFKNNSFDLIWCSEVIEHLDKPKDTIKEFKRILKKDGKMIITTPNSYFLLMRFLYLFGLSPKKVQRDDHKHFFYEKDIRSIFPDAKIYGYFPYFIIKLRIKKLLGALTPTFVIIDTKK